MIKLRQMISLSLFYKIWIILGFILSPHLSYAQSVADIIAKNHNQDINNSDVTAVVFTYGRIIEANTIFNIMIENPSQSVDKICGSSLQEIAPLKKTKSIEKKAMRWVYTNMATFYAQILTDLERLEQLLAPLQQAETENITKDFIAIVKKRRAIMQEAGEFYWTKEFLAMQLEKNDLALDAILINYSRQIATTAYDTFHSFDANAFKSVKNTIDDLMQNGCWEFSQEQDPFREAL